MSSQNPNLFAKPDDLNKECQDAWDNMMKDVESRSEHHLAEYIKKKHKNPPFAIYDREHFNLLIMGSKRLPHGNMKVLIRDTSHEGKLFLDERSIGLVFISSDFKILPQHAKNESIRTMRLGILHGIIVGKDLKVCFECGLPATKMCSKCGTVRYCSKECQRVQYPIHRRI